MMPPPTHLHHWAKPDSDVLDEDNFSGRIQCPCGCETFDVLDAGETYHNGVENLPCTVEVRGKYFFLIQVKCTDCGEEKTIFDADFHGWDGYVGHNPKQARLARPSLQIWNCNECAGSVHKVRVQVQTEGKQDFIEEAGKKFPAERWVDGFSWIDINLTCAACGKETVGWVSYETMD